MHDIHLKNLFESLQGTVLTAPTEKEVDGRKHEVFQLVGWAIADLQTLGKSIKPEVHMALQEMSKYHSVIAHLPECRNS